LSPGNFWSRAKFVSFPDSMIERVRKEYTRAEREIQNREGQEVLHPLT
jgi:hypothetical protein